VGGRGVSQRRGECEWGTWESGIKTERKEKGIRKKMPPQKKGFQRVSSARGGRSIDGEKRTRFF